jgi:A1 cistron-splicing factor AAR2
VEYSGGNFFVPALERLYRVCKKVEGISNESVTDPLATILWRQFQIRINNDDDGMHTKEMDSDDDDEENVMEIDVNDGSAGTDISTLHTKITADSPKQMAEMDSDDEEEDGPAVVPYDEVEASMERTAAIPPTPKKYEEDAKLYQNSYPLLFAATTPQEDVVMACARILSDATDVSLVREAAAYLEEVEAKQDTLF